MAPSTIRASGKRFTSPPTAAPRAATLSLRAKARFLTRAQFAAHNLAGNRRGELVHELDFARRLMRGKSRFHVRLDFLDHLVRRFEPWQQLHECFDRLAALRIRHAYHGA